MIIEENYPLGTDIKEFMQLEDIVFEVDNKSLTNRPDLWGHYGIAREIAALNKRQLKPLELVDSSLYKDLAPIDLRVDDNQKTYRFSCITMDNIRKKNLR